MLCTTTHYSQIAEQDCYQKRTRDDYNSRETESKTSNLGANDSSSNVGFILSKLLVAGSLLWAASTYLFREKKRI